MILLTIIVGIATLVGLVTDTDEKYEKAVVVGMLVTLILVGISAVLDLIHNATGDQGCYDAFWLFANRLWE